LVLPRRLKIQPPQAAGRLPLVRARAPGALAYAGFAEASIFPKERSSTMRKTALLVASLLSAATLAAQSGSETLKSPDSKLEIAFETLASPPAPAGAPAGAAAGQAARGAPPAPQPSAQGGQLTYRVSFNGKPLLLSSQLGLDFQGHQPLGTDVRIVSAERSQHDETYRLVWGKNNPVRDRYHALRLTVEDNAAAGFSTGRRLIIEARAYDDGVAFRYVAPEQLGRNSQSGLAMREFRLVRELTNFRFASDATVYPLYRNSNRTSYEGDWVKTHLTRLLLDKLIGLPLLAEVPGAGWMAITEADLDQYAGMYLVNASGQNSNTTLSLYLSPRLDDPALAVSALLPHHSPWRVLMIGEHPGRLVESNIILNLNPPCAIADTSWIKPGKAAWNWWSGTSTTGGPPNLKPGMSAETLNYYIDFAARSGFEYMLVDAGWVGRDNNILVPRPELNLPEIIRYAGSRNVRIWLWLHWTTADRQMADAFPLYEKWGIAGVKIDFMDSNDQRMVDFYHRVARLAAEHHLMVDFHGAYPPTGLRRTYPNVLTHEGVLGLEYNKWSALPDPDHNTMIPFTRGLAGPMDYTPGGFGQVTREEFVSRSRDPVVMGTRAHQLALFVVLESPFQCVADKPGAYENEPAFEFIKQVPASFEETRVLSGQPGEHVVIARRLGKDWYLGAITNWSPRQVEIPLAFLGPGQFIAEVYADAPDAAAAPKHVTIEKRNVNAGTKLKLDMATGGGCAIRFRPAS
jgi:alpha-glucosidase